MADYRRMYTLLCKAVDDSIEPLESIPSAQPVVEALRAALLEAEEIYIVTSPEAVQGAKNQIIALRSESSETQNQKEFKN